MELAVPPCFPSMDGLSFRVHLQREIPALRLTVSDSGFPTGKTILTFRLRLRKDFLLSSLPRLTPLPGSLSEDEKAYSFPSSPFGTNYISLAGTRQSKHYGASHSTRFLPLFFARYRARSALLSSVVTVSSSRLSETPKDAVTERFDSSL